MKQSWKPTAHVHRQPFLLGPAVVDPLARTIEAAGDIVRVDLKAMEVLLRLAEEPAAVVSKSELFARVWPDQAVTDDVLPVAVHALRKALGDDASNPTFIETIPKAGYRLLTRPRRRRTPLPGWLGAAALALLAGAGVLCALLIREPPADALPILGGPRALHVGDYALPPDAADLAPLAAGLSRALATSLARNPSLRVVPFGDEPSFAGHRVDGGVESGAEGTVRVTTQLLDPTGRVVWGSTLDGSAEDATDLQDRLVDAFRRGAVPKILEPSNGVGDPRQTQSTRQDIQ